MDTPLRFGLIGCGTAGMFHARSIEALDGLQLVGVYDFSPESARRFAAAYGAQPFETLDALLACRQIDAVCICTPSGLHAAQALAAIQSGKHVLIEKPLATTVEDAEMIVRAAEQAGLVVDVVAQLRLAESVCRIRRAIADGELGQLTLCTLDMAYFRSEEYYTSSPWRGTWKMDGGGALMNQGIHGMDLLLYLLGPVKSVSGLARTLARPIETEDTAAAVLEFESGVLCCVSAATSVYPGSARCLKLHGTKGSITLTEDTITEWNTTIRQEDSAVNEYATFSRPETVPVSAHIGVLRDFAQAIRESSSPVSTAADGFNAVSLIKTVYEASKTGIPQIPAYIVPHHELYQ